MVSRDELYALVWSQPMTKVAGQLDVSGSYLARVCMALRVPRPERGYWAKLQVGKAPPIPPLPAARVGDLQEWAKDVALPPIAPMHVEPANRSRKRSGGPAAGRTHEVIGGARTHFEEGRKVGKGEYLRPYKKLLVDITVSQDQLTRSLETANALFNALEAQGHRVTIAHRGQSLSRLTLDENEVPKKRAGERYPALWSPSEPTVVYVGDVPIGLALVELSQTVLMRYVNGGYVREADYAPSKSRRHQPDHSWTSMQDLRSGRLRLIAYAPRHDAECAMQWQETEGKSLIDLIPVIVAAMPTLAIEVSAKVRAAELARKQRWQEYEEAQERRRREDDRKKVQASHVESRSHLEGIIADWAAALSVTAFFDGVEKRAAHLPNGEAAPILERLALARGFIGSLDPMEFFLAWRTPQERHQPAYDHNGDALLAEGDE